MTDTETGSLHKETGIRNTLKRYLGPDGVIMILLVLLAIVGIGITDFSPLLSHWYWLAMVVVTGIACIVMEWSRTREKGLSATSLVKNEVLIWLSVLVAVNLVYFLFHSGRLDSENTGLVILLILALATFLAGLRQDWRLCLLGVVLGGASDFGHLSGRVPLDRFDGGVGRRGRRLFHWQDTNLLPRTMIGKRIASLPIVSRAMAISNRSLVATAGNKYGFEDESIILCQAKEGGYMSEIPLGAEVECLDGPCGKTISIIINPTNKNVTHIVVRDKTLGDDDERLIPIEHLGESTEKRSG